MSTALYASRLKALGRSALRYNVVSPELCDDILTRLAPSLTPYVGGTIVDINPGAGLFSQKLHNLLKPRLHILRDQEYVRYSPFLDPLINAPGSRYVRQGWKETGEWDVGQQLSDASSSRGSGRQDNATLFVVNGAGSKLHTKSDGSFKMADVWASRFFRACRSSNESLARRHSRMLLWCLDSQKQTLLPRTVDVRRKSAFLLESHCHVNEVVGFGEAASRTRRDVRISQESARHTGLRMEQNQIARIEGREADLTTESPDFGNASRPWHEELRDLERREKEGLISQVTAMPPGHYLPLSTRKKLRREENNPAYFDYTGEYKRLKSLRSRARYESRAENKWQPLADEQIALDSLDLQCYAPGLPDSEKKKLLMEYDERTRTLKDKIRKASNIDRRNFALSTDNHHSFHMPGGPQLLWDQRDYEPLEAKASEFYPKNQVALLDLHNQNNLPGRLTEEQSHYFDMFASSMFATSAMNQNLSLLKTVAPGAYEALTPKVSEFADARAGGRRDTDMLRMRTLTPRMVWRLALEWEKWPFRP